MSNEEIILRKDQEYKILKTETEQKIPSLEAELEELGKDLKKETKKSSKYE